MDYEQDMFAPKTKPSFLMKRPPPRRKVLAEPPAPVGKKLGVFVHYALVRASKAPPRRRVLKSLRLDLIDASLFEVSTVRPHPEYPLICLKENRPAFDTEKELKAFLVKIRQDSNVFKIWRCDACDKFHVECYPIEPTGSTSGKHTRKSYFMALRGLSL